MKGYGFLSFAKDVGKSLSNKHGQKLLDSAKKSTTDAIKTASKRAIQKTAEATGDLIDNKHADKIMSISTELHSKKTQNNESEADSEVRRMYQKKDAYLQEKDNKLLMN